MRVSRNLSYSEITFIGAEIVVVLPRTIVGNFAECPASNVISSVMLWMRVAPSRDRGGRDISTSNNTLIFTQLSNTRYINLDCGCCSKLWVE